LLRGVSSAERSEGAVQVFEVVEEARVVELEPPRCSVVADVEIDDAGWRVCSEE
jgi:hypothetical protein